MRSLIICLDGAPFNLVSSLIADGITPNLAKLAQRGVWGPLESVFPPVTAPAFASILTGQSPTEHGVLHFKKNPLDDYARNSEPRPKGSEFVTSSAIRGKTFPDYLSMAGFTVGTIGVPLTYPPWDVGAFMVCGFLTPPSATVWTSPSSLGMDIEEWIPDYRFEIRWELDCRLDTVKKTAPEMKKGWFVPLGVGKSGENLLRETSQVTEQKTWLAQRLMEEWNPDLMMVYFRGPDIVQHYFFHRPDVLEAFYSRLDNCLGTIIEGMARNVDIFIISDHGFRPMPRRRFNTNAWLRKEGYLRIKGGFLSKAFRFAYLAGRSIKRFGSRIKKRPGKQGRISKRLVKKGKAPIAWEETAAYGAEGGIVINNTHEYESGKLGEEIKTCLAKFSDPETGEKVAQWVALREEVFQGPFVHKLPHILFETRRDLKPSLEISKKVFSTQPKGDRTGDHDRTGIFLAGGPNICRQTSVESASLMGIAPTLLHLFGLAIPDSMSGNVLPIFRSGTRPEQSPLSRVKAIGLTRSERLKIGRLRNP